MKKKLSFKPGPVKFHKSSEFDSPKAVPAIEIKTGPSMAHINILAKDIDEIKGDLCRLVELMALQWGDPFLKQAKEILEKHQGQEDF